MCGNIAVENGGIVPVIYTNGFTVEMWPVLANGVDMVIRYDGRVIFDGRLWSFNYTKETSPKTRVLLSELI